MQALKDYFGGFTLHWNIQFGKCCIVGIFSLNRFDNAPSVENFEIMYCMFWYSLGSKVLHDCNQFDSAIHD